MAYEIGAVRASASFDATNFQTGASATRAELRRLRGGFVETSRDAVRAMEGMASITDAALSKTAKATLEQIDQLTGLDRAKKNTSATTKAWVSQLNQEARSFDRLRASLDPLFAASKQYESAVEQITQAERVGIVSHQEKNRALEQAAQKYLGLVPAAEQAAKAQEKAAAKADSMRAGYEAARASVDPLYASSRQYEAMQRQMNEAVSAGVVTQKEASIVLQQASDRYLGTSSAVMGYSKAAQAGGFHTANMVAQFNDMGVMMAAGQSPLMLALQQGTQFNQILLQLKGNGTSTFGAIRTALLATISPMALLTIGVIAGTAALVQWGMSAIGAGNDVEKFKKRIDELEASLGVVDQRIDQSKKGFAELRTEFHGTEAEVRSLIAAQRDFDFGKVLQQAKDLTDELKNSYDGSFFTGTRTEELQSFGLLLKDTRKLAADLNAIGQANGLEQQLQAVRHMREHFLAMVGSQEEMVGSRAEFYETMLLTEAAISRALAKQREIEASIDTGTQAMIRQHRVYGESRAAAEKMRATAVELVAKYEHQAELQFAIATHGKNSAEVERLKREAAMRSVEALIEQKDFSGSVAEQVRAAAMAAHDAEVNSAAAARALREAEAAARGLASAVASAAGFSADLDAGVRVLEAEVKALERGADAAIASGLEAKRIRAESMRDAQIAAGQDRLIAQSQFALDMAAIERQGQLIEQKKKLAKASRNAGSAGAAASRNSVAGILQEIEQRRKLLSLTGEQRAKYEAIIQVQRRLGKESAKVSKAQIDALADQLVQMDQLQAEYDRAKQRAEDISGQITNAIFNPDGAKDAAKQMFQTFASEFVRRQIVLPIVGQFVGTQGAPAGLLGGGGSSGGGGLLGGGGGNLLNLGSSLFGAGGAVQGLWSGFGGVLSGGGLGSSFANLGGLISGSASGFGALGAALPALGVVAAGIAVLANGLKKEYDGRAVRGSLGADGFDGFEFDFWDGGFLRGDTQHNYPTGTELQTRLDDSARAIRTNVEDMAAALGLGAEAIADFTGEGFTIWLSGPNAGSQEEIAAALEAELSNLGDGMADLVLGTNDYARSGEGAYETLTRLGSNLIAVNDAMDLLGVTLFDVGLRGGDLASDLVDAFGGAEAMSTAVLGYWNAFYSEAERQETTLRRLQEEFADLGLSMPESREGFRALVESIDLSSASGQALYVQLLGLSGAMDQVLPQVGQFTAAMSGMLEQINGEIGSQIDAARSLAQSSKQAANLWLRTAGTLRDFLSDLLNTDLTAASSAQAHRVNQSRFETTFDLARGGDVQAAQDIPALAKAYLNSARANASSSLEYRKVAAAVQSQVQFLAGISDLEGANDEVLTGLYEQQIEVLTSLGNFLQLEGLTDTQVSELSDGVRELTEDWDGTVEAFQSSLGALEQAITNAEAFSYDDLVGRLDVAVSLADNAPVWLQRLVDAVDDDIRTTLDFIIRRDDLSAAHRWLATNSISEHVSTLDFVLREDLDDETRWLALTTASDLRRDLYLNLARDLDPGTRSLLLTQSSNLSRSVNIALTQSGRAALDRLSELRSIIGTEGDGTLTFGGGVTLTADRVFSDLVSSTSDLRQPLSHLSAMLGDLREAVDEDRRARERQLQISALQLQGRDAAAALGDRSEAQSLVDRVLALEASTGVDLRRSRGRDADIRVSSQSGRIIYSASHAAYGTGADIAGFRDGFWANGALEDQIRAYNSRYSANQRILDEVTAQLQALGAAPSFDGGGYTGNRPRSGGLDGKGGFWARLHPQETVFDHTKARPMMQGGSQGQIVAMLQRTIAQLSREVAGLRDESAAFQRQSLHHQRTTAKLMEKADRIGPAPARETA